eukprot:TRINITY_DN11141_c0_g1_i1.p1 TRINITY_DN11141_c0_g1~~TRINITY_DN11141_c0_g1_i1.p1  ORF type:complete len:881 (+),score=100.76 TRINITY_DN11141_c0_g1_i1:1284-3926(+)
MPRKRLLVDAVKKATHAPFSLQMGPHTCGGRDCLMKHIVPPTPVEIPVKLFASIPNYVKGESSTFSPHIIKDDGPLQVADLVKLEPVAVQKSSKRNKSTHTEYHRPTVTLSSKAAEVLLSGAEKELNKWRESRWFKRFFQDQLRNKISICAAAPSEEREAIKRIVDSALSDDSEQAIHFIHGETGSGKSTQVPQIILDELISKRIPGQIIVSQPRRVAAMTLADRVATERGQEVGVSVGYQVSGDRVFARGAATIDYCTVGYLANSLTRVLTNARDSNKCLFLIIDEVHDRSLISDLILYRLKHNLEGFKVTVMLMSATANMDLLKDYFNNYSINQVFLPGKSFGVKQLFQDDLSEIGHFKQLSEDLDFNKIANIISFLVGQRAIPESSVAKMGIPPTGSVLVFLPGKLEIHRIYTSLTQRNPDLSVISIYRGCPREEYDKAFGSSSRTKIILSTNICESSITIPDATLVINTGLVKRLLERGGTNVLLTTGCSQSSNQQRAGRAGRVQQGVCIHLFSKESADSRPRHPEPEAQTSPFTSVILKIVNFDCFGSTLNGVLSNLIEPPIETTIESSVAELLQLGAVCQVKGEIKKTNLGLLLGSLWMLPREGYFVMLACALGCLDWAVEYLKNQSKSTNSHDIQDAVLLALSRSGVKSIGLSENIQQRLAVNRLSSNEALTTAASNAFRINNLACLISEDRRRRLVSRDKCFNLRLPRRPSGWFIVDHDLLLSDGRYEDQRLSYTDINSFISLIVLAPALRAIQYEGDESTIGLIVDDWAIFTLQSEHAKCLMSYHSIIQKVLQSHFSMSKQFKPETSESLINNLAVVLWNESYPDEKQPALRKPVALPSSKKPIPAATTEVMRKYGRRREFNFLDLERKQS